MPEKRIMGVMSKGRIERPTTGLEVKDEAKYPNDCAEKLDRKRISKK